MSLENQFKELETLIETLETGSIDLDNSLKTYESAVKLASKTFKSLDKKEQEIIKLSTKTQNLLEKNDQ